MRAEKGEKTEFAQTAHRGPLLLQAGLRARALGSKTRVVRLPVLWTVAW